MISLQRAKQQFDAILQQLSVSDRQAFSQYVLKTLSKGSKYDPEKEKKLDEVIAALRKLVPLNGLAPKEQISFPKIEEYEGYSDSNTFHVDAFLYEDEEMIDFLEEQGVIHRNYCLGCGSVNICPTNFVTHSISRTQAHYLFEYVLSDYLSGKVLLDVGSRLGAVLYVGYIYSKASKLIGVEVNKYWVTLQNIIVKQFNMGDRIQIIHDDIKHQKELLQTADVIVLHNVFECFVPQKELKEMWRFMMSACTKRGSKIVAIPALEQSLRNAALKVDISSWVKEIPIVISSSAQQFYDEEQLETLKTVHLYEVL